MEVRRPQWFAAVRLAVVVSLVAAAVAIALNAFGDVSQTALIIAVIVVGFVVSWVRSGRAPHGIDATDDISPDPRRSSSAPRRHGGDHTAHRSTSVRIHHHTG